MDTIFSALASQAYFGNTLLQYAYFFASLALALIAGKILSFLIKNHFRFIASKTKTKLDDLFLDLIEKPISLIMLVTGLWLGMQFMSFPEGIAAALYNIINVLAVLVVAWFLINFIDRFIKEVLTPIVNATDTKVDDQIIPVVSKLSKIAIAVLALVIIISNFGYDITALIAGLGIGGLAIAFAAQETIADIFGGLSIFTSKPFVVGDSVEIGKIVGKVDEVGLRHTRIRNLDKRIVIIPNSQIAKSVIINITSAPKRKCMWHLGLTYDTSVAKMKKAKKIAINAINAHPECEDDPIVAFEEFGDSSLKMLMVFYTKENDFAQFVRVRDSIGLRVKEEFEKAKIEFAFPTQTIHLAK